jgi:hypothetical protein
MGLLILTRVSGEKYCNLYHSLGTYLTLRELADYCTQMHQVSHSPLSIDDLVENSFVSDRIIQDAWKRKIILVPFDKKLGYGEVISFGADGKPGGKNKEDRDLVVRFPIDTPSNLSWNTAFGKSVKPPQYSIIIYPYLPE